MPDWEERISRGTAPATRAEHELRYELAAPLVADAALWCDLGCGNGVAAARIARRPGGRALLVDVAPRALVLRQVVLQGSAIVHADADPELRPADAALEPQGVPSHMLAVFGPDAARVRPGARVVQTDMEEQRRWERQRESDITQLQWELN